MSNGDLPSGRLVSSSPRMVGTSGFGLCGWGLLVVFALLVAGLGVVSSATARTGPARPSGLSAAAGTESVSLSWADPGDDSITGYQYRQRKGKSRWGGWVDVSGSDADTVFHVVSGLDAGVKYRFRIRAQNGDGYSKRSKVASAVPTAAVRGDTQGEDAAQVSGGVVAPPRDVTVVSQSGDTVTFGWKRPSSSGCALATDAFYVVDVGDFTSDDVLASKDVISDKTGDDVISTTVTGLSPGTRYRAFVYAYSDACDDYSEQIEVSWYQSAGSMPTTTTMPGSGVVARPLDFVVVSQSGDTVTLGWKRPSSSGCALGTDAFYIVDVGDFTSDDTLVTRDVISDKTGNDVISTTVTGLSSGTRYRAFVTAYSASCDEYSEYVGTVWFQSTFTTSTSTSTTTLPVDVVANPRDLTASPSGTGVTLSWKRPSGDVGGCALEADAFYVVDVGDFTSDVTLASRDVISGKTGDDVISTTVTGLSSGVRYRAYVAVYSEQCYRYSGYISTEWYQ